MTGSTADDVHRLAAAMPHVTVEFGSQGNAVYQVGRKSFDFFPTPRPDAVDPDTGERYDDVIVLWVADEEDKRALVEDPEADPAAYAEVTGYERWNLILVLMVVQFVQVVLLAVCVFAFLMLFGTLIMSGPVLDAWQTDPEFNTSRGLVQVSTFLAAFSGLYLTVSTVTDETYREQFFSGVTRELERAVGMRAVYLAARERA